MELAALTDRVIAFRVVRKIEGKLEMSRLAEKLAKAAGVAGRQTVKIEARADSLIAREAAIEAKTDQAFSPHEALLAEAEKGLDAVERSLALLSNDPLERSGESQEGQQSPFAKAVATGTNISPEPAPAHTDTRTFDRMG